MGLGACRECGKLLSTEARRCVHCGAPARSKIGAGGVLLTLITIGGMVYLLSDAPRSSVRPKTDEEHARTACYMAQEYVKTALKAPKSAEFGDCYSQTSVALVGVTPLRYYITGYVDAQNSFSAMIRTRYVAEVEQVDATKGTWRLVQLKL